MLVGRGAPVRDRARPRRAARRGARVPRADRPRLRARGADPQRRPRLGRARGLLRRRRAAVHRRARALRRGAVRPGRDGDRARAAVLPARGRSPTATRSRGLPNRRALDERMEDAVARGAGAGQRPRARSSATSTGSRTSTTASATRPATARSCAAGQALVEAAEAFPGSIDLPARRRRVLRADGGPRRRRRARAGPRRRAPARGQPGGPLTMSCGVACLDDEHRRASDLFRAADAAQYAAKRVGGDKLFVAEPGIPTPPAPAPEPWSRRRFRDAGPAEREALVRYLLASARRRPATARASSPGSRRSPTPSPRPSTRRAGRSRAARRARPRSQTLLGAERRDRYDPDAPDMRFTVHDETYALADYPLTADVMETRRRLRDRGDRRPRADPDERALLAAVGLHRGHGRRGARARRVGVARRALLRPAHARAARRAARAAAAGRRGGRPRRPAPATTPDADVARRRARTPRRSGAGPRPCGARTASTPRRRPGS